MDECELEIYKQRMVGVKYLVAPELWPAAAPLLKEAAVQEFAELGRLMPGTWNREVRTPNPQNPADYDDDGNLIDGVLVIYTADVMPYTKEN